MDSQCDIGLIGLAVMGRNLVLNMADHGFQVAVFNRTTRKVDEFMAGDAKGKAIVGCQSPEEFVQNLKRPRRVMMMVKAGEPVDGTIRQFEPLLEAGDILIEITRDIFSVIDPETDHALVDMIQDKAGQKGTGKWTSQLALDLGVPTTLITEAVFARILSSQKEKRMRAGRILAGPRGALEKWRESVEPEQFIEAVRQALYASKICSYAQGFFQLQAAAGENGWDLNYGEIAMMWRGGCIIRAVFLERIKEAFEQDAGLENLLLDPYFKQAVASNQDGWRQVVATAAAGLGIPVPAISAALNYYDGYRSERLPHNLLQAQRDYFGAHTYERIDREGNFHSDWIGLRRQPQE